MSGDRSSVALDSTVRLISGTKKKWLLFLRKIKEKDTEKREQEDALSEQSH